MARTSRRMRQIRSSLGGVRLYSAREAIQILLALPSSKFDQTLDIALKLGVDPRKSDQNVRGTVSLPHGTGKKVRVLVFAKGDKVKEALKAGADFAGFEEYFEKVKSGWTDFDAVVSTPDLMRDVGKLGRVLGPRNLMPTPRAGTVTEDLGAIISSLKAGQIEFKLDRHGVINSGLGKVSFSEESLLENLCAFVGAVLKNKPAAAKGTFLQRLYLSSTMGPGLRVDVSSLGL
ncbi:50S ribosomal protein L1 [Candidatus Similichlamydia laticola]|uniref:Large ribosomal subunit protein uL1 n=1 Tax=Candidatus Similichlamydia laticola TaxID=2170265 RepID=A0A369KDL9_9BACT|nr:50S ribosomal protein L1 [Candidatus Similichlamydia laticola]RDB31702.1 LSU ribosomal protein L1p (L10Ae) [Candidatus Similichlamydia laticola]